MDQILEWILFLATLVAAPAITLWVAGAIYYDVSQETRWGRLLAIGWVIGVIAMFVSWQPLWQPSAALLALSGLFLAWWLRQKPSNERDWDPAVATLPWAVREGDAVTIHKVRNFKYRTLTDFIALYETRTFHLTHLKSVDIIFFNWGSPWMSHPVAVFDFGPDGRICVSIEVRYRKGQKYSVIRSLYRRQELIFVAADERDVILRRTKYDTSEKAYLFRFVATPDELHNTFLDYVQAINALHDTPRWYNGLCANCTTSFYWLPNSRVPCDWRVLANGRLDKAFYESGRLDRSLPFPELHRNAYLNEIANSAPEGGFGDYIRFELEKRRHVQCGHADTGS
jgi:hypothetical protein